MKIILHLCRTGMLALLPCAYVGAQVFVLNGSASSLGGDCYQLVPDSPGQAGSIFSQNPVDLTQPFTIDASLFLGCKDGNGADGIVFILATSNTALGGSGQGIGYLGITPSIAVEYDDYFNTNFADPTADHMAIISMGSMAHNMSTNLSGPVTLPNIEDCVDHCFTVDWNPLTLTLTSSFDGNTLSYTGDIVTSIFSGTNLVYYGFSAGTGALSNIHRVCFGPPPLDPLTDEVICEGESTELQADENGIAWTWAPHPTLTPLNVSNPTATPTITTTYTVLIEYACGYFHNDTVIVEVSPTPSAIATNDGPICEGGTLSLMASGGTSYQWSGPMGYSSSTQNPTIQNITAGMAGTYTVTVTDAAGCTAETTTVVVVDTGPVILIDPVPDPVCTNTDPFQLTASPSGGTWLGEITPDGLFDPAYAGEGAHTIQYVVSNMLGCINTQQILIEVYTIPEILIDPPGILCEESIPVQLTASPPGGIWEGEITINGLFDPGAAGDGPHLITYTANDANGCTNSADIIVEVVPGVAADISPEGPFCATDPPVQLTADPPGGQWGGAANALGIITPANIGPGLHLVTYTLTDQNGCYFGQADIEILDAPEAVITAIPALCLNDSIQTLTATPAGGTWSGAADPAGQVDPAALGTGTHQVIYTYTLTGGCSATDTFDLLVLPASPQAGNLTLICDSLSASYVVLFSITGGDPLSYSVTGSVSGTLLPGNPTIFTSDPIASGDPYSFTLDDINHCDPVILSGDHTCNCATNAGSMDLNAITACEGNPITVIPPVNSSLDPDDSLVYVLHLGFPDSVILVSDTNVFGFGPPLLTGTTYFISSVAGNGIAGTGVDFNDPCLSVSFGTPVMWVAKPTGSLAGTSPVCSGDSAMLIFTSSGTGPFDIVYTDGSANYSLSGISSGQTITVYADTTTMYTLTEIADPSAATCSSMPGTSATIEIIPAIVVPFTARICEGDSMLLGGTFQSEPGIYDDSLVSIVGCDSIVVTTLTVSFGDTIYLFDTSCDTALTGIFVEMDMNQSGCDSITITTVTWVESDTTLLASITCDPLQAGTFTDLYTGQSGCDSLVIETIAYSPPDTTYQSGTTCDAGSAGTFIQTLTNGNGCDSLIIETILLIPSDTTYLTDETCDASAAGTFTQTFINSGGCDSMVIETISLLPSDTLVTYTSTCLPQDTGTMVQTYMNMFGCDSLVWSFTSLAPYDSCHEPPLPKDVFIPNVFSPNGDGINDLFLLFANPAGVSDIPYLRIFDRWGGLVFERMDVIPNDPSAGWDGTEKGEPVSPGVFVCVIHVRYVDGKEDTRVQDITLIR